MPVPALGGGAALAGAFAVTLFFSALLLFWVQPLIAKLILPLFGGSPAVWTTALVFFQTMLLAGYAFAYALDRWLRPSRQLAAQAALLAAGATVLPIAVAVAGPASQQPAMTVLILLTAAVALPFLALSATAPLLQRWFARSRHPHAADPYFLYGASNLGSVAALIAFPLLFERAFSNAVQGWLWTAGYGLVAAFVAALGVLTVRRGDDSPAAVAGERSGPAPTGQERLAFVLYAAVPASLLLGVTAHITTDIAAAPLLWLLPLLLYLLSFILVFVRRPLIDGVIVERIVPLALVVLAAIMVVEAQLGLALPVAVQMALHLGVFFAICLQAHGSLYRRRPGAAFLTQFYLCLALGGMLGGILTALLAPVLFAGIYEYPLALATACLLLPRTDRDIGMFDIAGAATILTLVLGFDRLLPAMDDAADHKLLALAALIPAVVIALAARPRRLGFALAIAALLVGSQVAGPRSEDLWRGRSFFGAYRIAESDEGLRLLYHGSTVHGAEWTRPAKPRLPATYYALDSPVAEVIDRRRRAGGLERTGVVGLGVGSLSCYRRPGERWRFYEIDPLVIRIAAGSGYFRFLADCPPGDAIVEGDGRLRLADETEARFDLLIIDAFTSDAIPLHLLTREALHLYRERLAPGGVLLLHISNRHVDLVPVLGRLAADLGLAARVASHRPETSGAFASLASDWIALAAEDAALHRLGLSERWQALGKDPRGRVWTDDFSNIVEAIRWW